MTENRFAKYAWFVLIYNLAAIAWGVFLRAGEYGDGCGKHWPLCGDDTTPFMGAISRLIEGSHRFSTMLCGVFAIVLIVWAFRQFPKGSIVRFGASCTMAMTLFEGLIGAWLVKNELVVKNDSVLRAVAMGTHGVSTLILVGAIAFTAISAGRLRPIRLSGQGHVLTVLGMAAVGLCLLGVSGGISALAHQLHATPDVLKAAMDPKTHWMVRLQPLHPLIAASVGLYILLAVGMLHHLRPDAQAQRLGRWVVGIFGAQVLVGGANIFLDAPIAMQMVHLVVADMNWVALVLFAALCLQEGVEQVEHRPVPDELENLGPTKGKDLIKAYVALTKPRVISLLLFTALASAIAAKGSWPGFEIFMAVFIGGYFAAGAANTINMVVDRDIDFAMKRTRTRPTVTQAIPTQHALWFAFSLASLSFAILWGFANLLSAVMAFSGLVFYVVVYTMLLKRRTWHNIVIGGAAGAFPPLVGWAAVTNSLPPLALYLFAIIFVWTPVHFWALALLIKDDYAAAGVPMLPVVKGDKATVQQIAAYAVVTTVVTLLPFFLPQVARVGWVYAASATLLNAILLQQCVQLYRKTERASASRLFHYSMLYLAILFLMLAIDRTIVLG